MGTKVTDLGAIVTVNVADVFPIVDVSDNTQAPSGSTKKITITQLEAKFSADGFLSSGDNISELVNNSGYITSNDFNNGGEAGGANRDLGNTDAFALSFITNGVGRINILSTGEVGIGTSTPAATLDVVGSGQFSSKVAISTTVPAGSNFLQIGGTGNAGIALIGSYSNSAINITNTGSGEAIRVNNSAGGIEMTGSGNPLRVLDITSTSVIGRLSVGQDVTVLNPNKFVVSNGDSVFSGSNVTVTNANVDVTGTGIYKIGGVNGFTGTGAYTNFTIVGGIITAAS